MHRSESDVLIARLGTAVTDRLGDALLSLYFFGSRVHNAAVPSSDWDLLGIMADAYDFAGEERLNVELSETLAVPVRFRGVAWSELRGGPQQGTLTRFVPLPALLRGFHLWLHLSGMRYTLEDFMVSPASAEDERDRALERLRSFRMAAGRGILPFPIEDYVKTAVMLVGAEQELRGLPFTLDYREVARREPDPRHIVHRALALREGKSDDYAGFLQALDAYLA